MALQTLQYLAAPIAYLSGAQRRHGDVFIARLLGDDWVVLADPELAREVFATSPRHLNAGEASQVLEPLIGTRNTLMLDGEEYLQRRRLLLPALHGRALREQERVIRELAAQQISTWPTEVPLAALPRMQTLAAMIIKQCVLGDSGGELASATLDLLAWVTSTSRLAYYFTLGAGQLMRRPGYRRRLRRVEQSMREEIEARRRDPDLQRRSDILSMLVAARDERGEPLPDKDIRDETITLLVAGHENTAAVLAWVAHELARSPQVQRELASDPETWVDPVITETLRLRPPVPLVPRRLTVPLTIGGYALAAGTNIAPCALLIQRDGRVYPDPLSFRPERFLEEQPTTATWFPFGGSVRRCIGDAFARLEIRIVLQELAARYRLRPGGRAERARPRALVFIPSRKARVTLSRQSLEGPALHEDGGPQRLGRHAGIRAR